MGILMDELWARGERK